MKSIAVVGIGRMGGRHALNIAKGAVKGGKLVAVCDLDKEKLNNFAAKHEVAAYTDIQDMLSKEKLDGVIVATPHYSHVGIAKACVEKGVSVLVEKPISVTVEEAKELIDALDKRPEVIGAMMFNQRTNRMYSKAKELIEKGVIGKVQRANFIVTDWYRTQFYYDMGGWRASWSGEGGGTLINQCVHQLDIMQWLLGMPKAIFADCKTKARNISTQNDVTAIMRYDDFNCTFTASTHEVPGTNRFEIAGDKGKIVIDKFKMTYYINKYSESQINSAAKRDYGNPKDKKSKKHTIGYGIHRLIYDTLYGQQARVLNNFVKAISLGDKTKLIAQADEGLRCLTLINAMNMSSWLDREIKLPLDDKEYAAMLAKKIEEEKN